MLTGVEILLERMKTNPEEFVGVEGAYSKWGRLINGSWETFTTEEQKALQDGIAHAKREHFNGEVMRLLSQGYDDQLGRAENYSTSSNIITSQNLIGQGQIALQGAYDYAGQNTANSQAAFPKKRAK